MVSLQNEVIISLLRDIKNNTPISIAPIPSIVVENSVPVDNNVYYIVLGIISLVCIGTALYFFYNSTPGSTPSSTDVPDNVKENISKIMEDAIVNSEHIKILHNKVEISIEDILSIKKTRVEDMVVLTNNDKTLLEEISDVRQTYENLLKCIAES